jgi:hypothetical protein
MLSSPQSGGRSLKALGGIPPYSIGVEYEAGTAHVVRSVFLSQLSAFLRESAR